MSKDTPSAPPAPDPAATAAAQSTANVNTAAAQAALNYVNQNTPYGSTKYTQTGTYKTPSGEDVPTYTQDTQLSPLGQSILTGEQGVVNTLMPSAQNLAKSVGAAIGTPLNFNTPYSATLNAGPQQLDQNATNAIYQKQASFLDPQWKQQGALLEDQLARQGIPVGSDAYKNAMEQFDNSKTQAYDAAQNSAIAGGANSASQLFNMALAGQQQNVGQQQLAQQQPLSLLAQLFGAAPTTPSQPIVQPSSIPIGGTDVIGATGLASNAAMQGYQAQVASQNANSGALGSLAGTGIMAGAIII